MKDILNNIIRSRKSVFPVQYNGDVIDDNIINEILYNANTAPTHRITQPWLFKVFDKNSKFKLAEEILKLKFGNEIPEKAKSNLLNKFTLSSHIICICMDRNTENLIPEWEEIAAVSMSVQNMWLSCTVNEIGCYWSSPAIINSLNKFLHLKSNQRCLGLFYMGKYDELPQNNLKKKSIKEKVTWI